MTQFLNSAYFPPHLCENVLIWDSFCISVLTENSALIKSVVTGLYSTAYNFFIFRLFPDLFSPTDRKDIDLHSCKI
jgi:hypothetical protein